MDDCAGIWVFGAIATFFVGVAMGMNPLLFLLATTATFAAIARASADS